MLIATSFKEKAICRSDDPQVGKRKIGIAALCLLIPNLRDIADFVKELCKYQVNSFPQPTCCTMAVAPTKTQRARSWQLLAENPLIELDNAFAILHDCADENHFSCQSNFRAWSSRRLRSALFEGIH
jgi:hypothetical protein